MNNTLFHGDMVTSRRILYTPSGFAKSSLVYLQEIGELEAHRPHISGRENLESFLFFMVKRGSGTLQYQGQEVPLSAGDCVFVDCKKGYSHATSDDLWTLQWVHFFGGTMPEIYRKYLERGGAPVFHPAALDSFVALLDRIYALADSTDYIRDMRINEGLTALLTLLMEQSLHPEAASAPASKKQTLLQIRDYLDQHFPEKITLDVLAEHYYMNKYYLAHMFKDQFGMTVVEYLLNLRITHAKRLLRFSDLTTEAIGAACGMPDANYFSRVFRKLEGIPPSEYRRLWRAQQ